MQQLSLTLFRAGFLGGESHPRCGAGHRGEARLGVLPGPCLLRSGSAAIGPVSGMRRASLGRSQEQAAGLDRAVEVLVYDISVFPTCTLPG